MRACSVLLLLRGLSVSAAAQRAERRALEGDGLALVQGLVSLGGEKLHVSREEEEESTELFAENLISGGSAEGAQEASDSGAVVVSTVGANASANATANATGAGAPVLPAEVASLKERVALLEAAKLKAIEIEDYDLAKQLKREVEVLLAESDVDRLRILKQAAVQDEDYDLAKDLKRRIQVLENSTGSEPSLADKVKAYYTDGRGPLPWGWRSARDPASGMDYFWPVNDRSAVTWDRPTTAAVGVPPPQAPPTSVVRTTTPPPPFEVQSADGHWSRCNVLGNGTKPGTYNITVRAGSGSMELPNIPGTVIRNVSSNTTLLTSVELSALIAADRAAREALRPKVGDRLEVRTKSNSWVPCVVTGLGNETNTYNIHVPFAPVDHRDHFNVSSNILRKATTFGTKTDEQAANATDSGAAEKKEDAPSGADEKKDEKAPESSADEKKDDKAEAAPSKLTPEER